MQFLLHFDNFGSSLSALRGRVCNTPLAPPFPVNFTEQIHLGSVAGEGAGPVARNGYKEEVGAPLVPAVTSPTEDEQIEEPSQTVTLNSLTWAAKLER